MRKNWAGGKKLNRLNGTIERLRKCMKQEKSKNKRQYDFKKGN